MSWADTDVRNAISGPRLVEAMRIAAKRPLNMHLMAKESQR
jgi:pentose-5-phosphate-3-epimerase